VVGSRTGSERSASVDQGRRPSSIQIAPTPGRVAIAARATPRAFRPRRTITVVVAQTTNLSTPDPSESRVPIRTIWTERVTEKHASGHDQDAHLWICGHRRVDGRLDI
jgi:hypothetical protein